MNKKIIKKRIEKLRQTIDYYRYMYHVKNKSLVSDSARDSLMHQLVKLEEKYPEFKSVDSPSQRISGKPLKEFKKIKHQIKQWSFNDAFNEEELKEWEKRILRKLKNAKIVLDYTAELKIDGLHIVLTYQNGRLITAATRGDGVFGEDVTQNICTIQSIPLKLKKPLNIIVEGEIFMPKNVFEELNKKRKKNQEQLLANPRNSASGAIRQLNPKIAQARKLDSFIYDLVWADFSLPKTQKAELRFLHKIGFKVNQNWQFCQNITEINQYFQSWLKKKDALDYWLDGVVVKVNQRIFQEKLGHTGKAPRWAIALKFPSEEAVTRLIKIKIQIGRTGALTPVAVLEPVSLGGSIIRHATLHNADEIKRLDIRIGDTVIVRKAGDIIPDIVKVIQKMRTGKEKVFSLPKKCPVCESIVRKETVEDKRQKTSIAYFCVNKNCFAQNKRKIIHFVSKKGFDIEGLGRKIVEQLMNQGLVRNGIDIFKLKKTDLESLERFAQKSADNLVQSIEKSKKIELNKFLYALGIRYLGEETARILAERISQNNLSIEKISAKDEEWFKKIEGIGDKVAKSLCLWFQNKKNVEFLKDLQKIGVKIIYLQASKSSNKLQGLKFALTGSLQKLTREQAKEKIQKLGSSVVNSISKKTDYVVLGENPGSKLKKAQNLKVKILKEWEFLEMVK